RKKIDKPDQSSMDDSTTVIAPQANAAAEKADRSSAKEDTRLVQMDYDNADITHLIEFMASLTGKIFIVDPSVKGKVTIISPTKLTVDEAYKTFESILEVNNLTTVPSGNAIKIIQDVKAIEKDIETRFGDTLFDPEDKIITQIIPLTYISPSEFAKVFSKFSSRNGIIPYDQTGMLIIIDTKSNIARILKIIKKIDVPGTGEEISVIPLKQASAQTMASNLERIFNTSSGAAKKAPTGGSRVTIVPDERTNSLVIVASEVEVLKIRELIDLLDKDRPKGEGDIHVYYLQNADAEELAKTLMAIPTDNKQGGQQGVAAAPVISKDTHIVADKATNSLIITAQKDEYEILEDVIEKLDMPRSMVYIEALVMEVSMKKDLQIGVQWQVGEDGSSNVVYAASNPGVNNFPSIDSSGNVSLPTGLTYGVLGDTIKIGGLEFADLGAVFRAYSSDSDVQIHSNPMITTLDNEEAELKVTDEVPFITRRDERDNSSSYAGYSNYDYKEVGIILTITPQINQERFVRLKLNQEVSQVLSFNEDGQPTTFKRAAKTTVRIKDGQTLVIGGLIDKKDNRTNYRVPLLGRIPILGWLFRSRTDTTDKKNMYIFLTPRIMENVAEADEISQGKKEHIDTIKKGVIRMHSDGKQPEDMRRVELGYKYLQLGEYEKALKYYRKALDENPNNPYAIYNIGYIYQLQGEGEKAVDMYEKLIAMDPPERAIESSDPFQTGKRLTDMAKDNLKSLKANE
ncbi:MAG: type II secretion system secretin GspD, partial [Deltaproteobacteria bacterium]|nr:type II secretion system secretin GspD [Deltaproteobacteria bacterium]